MCTSVAGWSHVEDLQRIFIPHCWINSGPVLKGYAVILKVWVAFLVLFFFFSFCLGLCLKSGHYKLSAGRPLLVIRLSRINRNKWAKDSYSRLIFVEMIFFFFLNFPTTETCRLDEQSEHLDHTMQRGLLEIVTGKLLPPMLLEITYVKFLDYLLLS